MGTAGAGSKHRPGRGTPTLKPVSHCHIVINGRGTIPTWPAYSKLENGTAGDTGAAEGLGRARVGEGLVGPGAWAVIRTPQVSPVGMGLLERKGAVGGLEVSLVGYLVGFGRQPGNHFARRRAFAGMMPRPRPHSHGHAAVPRHNNSWGCQQGAA